MLNKSGLMIAPSLLAADQMRLGEEIKKIKDAGADLLHIDVMDGHFVPNLGFSPDIVKAVRKSSDIFLDVHLMISEPLKYIEVFKNAGADLITVHSEVVDDLEMVSEKIHNLGIMAGICVKPKTDIEAVLPYVKNFDLLLIMTVEPGFGGQSYMTDMNDKIRKARRYIDENGLNVHIQVDGGVKPENASEPYEAGANILVAGSAVFNATSPEEAVKNLKSIEK